MKKCAFCGEKSPKNSRKCKTCGCKLDNKHNDKLPLGAIILIAFISIPFILGMIVAILTPLINSFQDSKVNNKTNNRTNIYFLNEPFIFDDLEITLKKNISYTTIDCEGSEDHGKTAIKVPVTVKNLRNEPHYLIMFYYNLLGPNETEMVDVSDYFIDDCIKYADKLNPGESYIKYFYFLYDGNGVYKIEFDDLTNKTLVEFVVIK